MDSSIAAPPTLKRQLGMSMLFWLPKYQFCVTPQAAQDRGTPIRLPSLCLARHLQWLCMRQPRMTALITLAAAIKQAYCCKETPLLLTSLLPCLHTVSVPV